MRRYGQFSTAAVTTATATTARWAHTMDNKTFGQKLDAKGLKALNEGRPHEAIEAWSELLEDMDKKTNAESPARLGPLNNLACAFGELGDHWKQTEILEEVLNTSRKNYGGEHQQCAVALYNLANAAGGIGKYKQMETLLKEAILVTAKNFHPQHAKVARCMILLAESMEGQGRHDIQVGLLTDSEKIIVKHVGKTHQQWTVVLGLLSKAYGRAGKLDEAVEFGQKTMAIEDSKGPLTPAGAIIGRDCAMAYGLAGKYVRQQSLLEEVLAVQRKHFGSDDKEQVATYMQHAECLLKLEKPELSLTSAGTGLGIAQGKYAEHHEQVGRAHLQVAKAGQALGDGAEWEPNAARAVEVLGWFYKDAECTIPAVEEAKACLAAWKAVEASKTSS